MFVQTVKNSLTKSMEGGENIHLAILSYITTPLKHSLPLPAELLNSMKFRCLLPSTNGATKPYPQVQESDARSKASTSKTLKQECQGFTQCEDWKCSTYSVSATCEKVGPWGHN